MCKFASMVYKARILGFTLSHLPAFPSPFLSALPSQVLFLLKMWVSLYWDSSYASQCWILGHWTFCGSRERIYDDLLGETKGLIQWVGERWVSLLMVIREDLVSRKLSGCECTFFAWFMSLEYFLHAQWTRGLFARKFSSCHPKLCFWEEQKPKDQALFALLLLDSSSMKCFIQW